MHAVHAFVLRPTPASLGLSGWFDLTDSVARTISQQSSWRRLRKILAGGLPVLHKNRLILKRLRSNRGGLSSSSAVAISPMTLENLKPCPEHGLAMTTW